MKEEAERSRLLYSARRVETPPWTKANNLVLLISFLEQVFYGTQEAGFIVPSSGWVTYGRRKIPDLIPSFGGLNPPHDKWKHKTLKRWQFWMSRHTTTVVFIESRIAGREIQSPPVFSYSWLTENIKFSVSARFHEPNGAGSYPGASSRIGFRFASVS